MLPKIIVYNKETDYDIANKVMLQMSIDKEMEAVIEAPDMWIDSIEEAAYCLDKEGKPWIFATCKPWLDGAIFGIWIRPDKRHSREMVYAACEIYEAALQKYCVLVGYSKKPLTKMHEKMGYRLSGKIPGLWNGEDVNIWTLQREDFIDWRLKLFGVNK